MRHPTTALAAVLALAGCAEEVPASELEGTYEIVERVEGPCGGPLESSPPSADDRYFRLEEDVRGSEPLIAYFDCSGPDDCSTTRDLLRSFGPVSGGWGSSLATASTGCVLRYTRRELFPTDDGVEIIRTTYQETDESLVGDDCSNAEANERGDRMPCVSVVETRATKLDPEP
jgi:hypothetical protein